MNIKKTLFLSFFFLLTNPKFSLPMIGACAGAAHAPGVEPLDLSSLHITEGNSLFSNNSSFGSSIYQQDNFQVDYSTINLLHEAIIHHVGLDAPSVLDHIADRLLNSQASTHSCCDNTVSYNQETSDVSQVNNATVSTSVTVELQDLCDAPKVSQENPINLPLHSDVSRFSNDSAYENRHAENFEYASNESEESYGQYKPSKQNILTNIKARIRLFELLISSSYDPKALAAQIDASLCKTYLFRRTFHETTQAEYRNFLWDSKGNFKPIDNTARQEQAFNILYNDIKNYFGWSNKAGLINFLEKQVELKTPGAQRLLDLETGKTKWRDHIANVGNDISSAVASLNFFKGKPTFQQIEQGNFLKHLSKIVALCKAEKFAEAKDFAEQIRRNICSTPEGERIATVKEYNCLYNVYNNIYKSKYTSTGIKLEFTQDPFYKRFERSLICGAMKPHEAMKILEARDYAFKSISYRMGYDPKKLSGNDRSLIYKEIDNRTRNSFGLQVIFDHKDLLTDHELITLKEKLECFEAQQKIDNPTLAAAQSNNESTAVAPHEETEPIEPPSQIAQQESSITASPPPLEPKEPKEKDEKTNSQNTEIKNEGLKESNIYKKAIESIEKNVDRFEKLGINQLSKKVLRHIINHHYKIGEVAKRRDQTSMFKDDINLVDLILEALENGTEIEPGVKTYDCGKIIGQSLNGEPTTIITVFLNSAKNMIITVFPR